MEYPEMQMVTLSVPAKAKEKNNTADRAHDGEDKPPISLARKRFMEAALKVIADLAVKRDQEMREREEEEMEKIRKEMEQKKRTKLPPLFENTQLTGNSSRSTKNTAREKPIPGPGRKHGGVKASRKAPRVRLPEVLPGEGTKGPASVFVTSPRGFGMHLSSLVRLARFRKMMSRRENGGSHTSDESDVDDEAEDEIPARPRFCATLSPEAQYAMMKGYEDVLVESLTPSQPRVSHVLYRVKTPHQTVLALHVAEQYVTAPPPPHKHAHEQRNLLAPEDAKTARVFVTDPEGPRLANRQVSRNFSVSSDFSNMTSFRDNGDRVSHSKTEVVDLKRDKQIRMTCRFQKAMDILDTIKVSKGMPVTSQKENKRLRNPLKVYNTWCQGWSREFKFQYGHGDSEI